MLIKLKSNYIEKSEKDNGITLVALVITVIIIIILATVTLNFTFRREWNNNEGKPSQIYGRTINIQRRIRHVADGQKHGV